MRSEKPWGDGGVSSVAGRGHFQSVRGRCWWALRGSGLSLPLTEEDIGALGGERQTQVGSQAFARVSGGRQEVWDLPACFLPGSDWHFSPLRALSFSPSCP